MCTTVALTHSKHLSIEFQYLYIGPFLKSKKMYPPSFWKQMKNIFCRVRPVEEQILGQEHYKKEHTKPLLNKHNLMTVHNLYVYHCCMDTFKTLKYRIPISLYSLYLLSNRK